jgi:hypothetical protein
MLMVELTQSFALLNVFHLIKQDVDRERTGLTQWFYYQQINEYKSIHDWRTDIQYQTI